MKNIKLAFLLFFMGFSINQIYGQAYQFTTSGFSVLSKKENGKWGQWSETELINIRISLDTSKNRIVLYDQMIQIYQIQSYIPVEENDSDIVYSFKCKDDQDTACTLSIIKRKKQENRKQLYINYGKRIVMYNLFLL